MKKKKYIYLYVSFKVLNEDEFLNFYFKLMTRPDIDEIFAKYSEQTDKVSLQTPHSLDGIINNFCLGLLHDSE